MAKRKKKKPYNYERERTKGTAFMVMEEIKDIEVADILADIFVVSDDPFISNLITDINSLLVYAKTNPDDLPRKLHQYYKKKANEIKVKGKARAFFEYTQMAYEELFEIGINWHISCAYYDLVIQLGQYLTPTHDKPIGVSSDGSKFFTLNEMYKDIDKALAEATKDAKLNANSQSEAYALMVKHVRSYGYDVKTMRDIEDIFLAERTFTNMEFCMVPFIDESTIDMYTRPYIEPTVDSLYEGKRLVDTSKLKRALKRRRRLLPSKGITLEGYREDSNIDEVHLREKRIMNKLFMLYRIKIDGGYAYGYYNTVSGFFFSMYKDAKETAVASDMHEGLENYILELYAIITTDIETEREFNYAHEVEHRGPNKKPRVFNREGMVADKAHVEGYIRKLPDGFVASDEAMALAESYGIVLGDDETFVKPFVKSVRKKAEYYENTK